MVQNSQSRHFRLVRHVVREYPELCYVSGMVQGAGGERVWAVLTMTACFGPELL